MEKTFTLKEKKQYLLDNGYTTKDDYFFISPNGYIRVSIRDLMFCWNSLRLF